MHAYLHWSAFCKREIPCYLITNSWDDSLSLFVGCFFKACLHSCVWVGNLGLFVMKHQSWFPNYYCAVIYALYLPTRGRHIHRGLCIINGVKLTCKSWHGEILLLHSAFLLLFILSFGYSFSIFAIRFYKGCFLNLHVKQNNSNTL